MATATATKTPPATTPAPVSKPRRATVDRRALLDALVQVGGLKNAQSALPVLAGTVMISAEKGCLSVRTTDLDMHLMKRVSAKTAGRLDVVVPLKPLETLVRLASDPVTLEWSKTGLRFVSGTTSAELLARDWTDYPRIPDEKARWSFDLSASDVAVVRRVIPFASPDDARPILTGLYFQGRKVVATDSYRLAIGTVGADLGDGALLPAAAARHLPSRMLAEERVTVEVSDHQAWWEFDGFTVLTRRIQGEFPNWRAVTRERCGHGYTVSRKELATAIRRMEAVIPPRENAKPVRLENRTGQLMVTVSVADIGAVADGVPSTVMSPPDAVAFSPKFLRACLSAAQEDEVTIDLVDQLKPAVIEEGDFTMLLMPVRTH